MAINLLLSGNPLPSNCLCETSRQALMWQEGRQLQPLTSDSHQCDDNEQQGCVLENYTLWKRRGQTTAWEPNAGN